MRYRLLLTLCLLVWSALIQAQDPPPDLTDKEKIYGISKVWKEVDRNFVFFDQVPDLDWDSTYQAFLPRVRATTSTYAYFRELQRMVSLLQDGPTRVVVPYQLRGALEVRPPVVTELIDGRVVVVEVQNDTVRDQGVRRGMVVTHIDDVPVMDYATEYILPYRFYSTQQDREVQVYREHLLRGPKAEPVTLTMDDGQQFTVRRDLVITETTPPPYEFEVLAGNIGLLTLHRFWGEELNALFDSIYPALRKTDGLLIDVSANSGGDSGYAAYVMSHFYDRPVATSRWKTLKYLPAMASYGEEPGWEEYDSYMVDPVVPELRYLKPIALLISERTYSAGEDLVSAFATSDRGPMVGWPTAGTTGNPLGFALPGQGGFQVCTKRDYLADGREFVGYGIAPDVVVAKQVEDGTLIEAALRALRQ